jgi:hypothetical protein
MVASGSRTMIAGSLSSCIAGFPLFLQVITIIRPETLERWHRAGFRSYWRWKSRTLRALSFGPLPPARYYFASAFTTSPNCSHEVPFQRCN